MVIQLYSKDRMMSEVLTWPGDFRYTLHSGVKEVRGYSSSQPDSPT